MRSLIVPLADMIPEVFTRPHTRAIELPEADDALELIDDDVLRREASAAADAAVVLLCREDALVTRVDFHRVRALVEREVQVARGGPVHLTPLFLYLEALSSLHVALGVVRALADALVKRGLSAAPLRRAAAQKGEGRQAMKPTSPHGSPRNRCGALRAVVYGQRAATMST